MSKSTIVEKIEELMLSLDQVKKYRELARLVIDFAIIVLCSVALMLAIELFANYYRVGSAFYCYFQNPLAFTCNQEMYTNGYRLLGFNGISNPTVMLVGLLTLITIPVGVIVGIVWVNHKFKKFSGGAWKNSLTEGIPGALKLIQELDWNSVFEDIRISKIGYALYLIVKIIGYWVLAFVALILPYYLLAYAAHLEINFYILLLVSLALVLVRTRKDLQNRFKQVASLDTLLFELRWFESEFRRAESDLKA